MKAPFLTIGALAIAIACGSSVSAASPDLTRAVFEGTSTSSNAAPVSPNEGRGGGARLLAENDDEDYYDDDYCRRHPHARRCDDRG